MSAASTPIRLALVNDHPVVVEGLRGLLAEHEDLQVVELDALVDVVRPVDIALLDTFGQSETIRQAVRRRLHEPTIDRVVVFSWQTGADLVRDSLEAGASGVLSKTLGSSALAQALRRIAAGETVVARADDTPDDDDLPPRPRRRGRDWPGREHGLTMREAEMLTLISQGLTNDDICELLYLSLNSVKSYIRTAYAKIGAQSRSQAVIWAIDHGMRPAPHRQVDSL